MPNPGAWSACGPVEPDRSEAEQPAGRELAGPNHRLKFALLSSGSPQYEIARACAMGETRLSRIVRGRARPNAAERRALAARLGVPEAELFS